MSCRPAVHDNLDVGVCEHARERGGIGRVVAERVDHLGAHPVGGVGSGTATWARHSRA